MIKPREFHELASLFPMLPETEINLLAQDIKTNGLMYPITLYGDKIIDGRNRYKACELAGVEPFFTEYTGNDPLQYVISLNLKRRHLNPSQIDALTEKIANMRQGERTDIEPSATLQKVSVKQACALTGGSERGVQYVREIKKKAPERIAEIESGRVTIHNVLKDIKDTEKRQEISERFTTTEMPNGLFDVIYCDPPWQYEYSESLSRSIEMHYPSMTLGDIKNMNVPAEKDSVLLMWATAPKLEEALSVLNAWGFKYRTNSVWDKQIIGIGYWFRGQHELLLVGVKGNFSPPMQEDRVSSFYSEKRTEHSRKPDYYYDMIEKCFPARKYLELFSRKKHNDKWTTWGSENE